MLLTAIVERAFYDISFNKHREETVAWLTDDEADEDTDEFSFKWICAQLDYKYESLRDIARLAHEKILSGEISEARVSRRNLPKPKGATYEYFQNL